MHTKPFVHAQDLLSLMCVKAALAAAVMLLVLLFAQATGCTKPFFGDLDKFEESLLKKSPITFPMASIQGWRMSGIVPLELFGISEAGNLTNGMH